VIARFVSETYKSRYSPRDFAEPLTDAPIGRGAAVQREWLTSMGFLTVFAGLWGMVFWALARGGWSALQADYAFSDKAPGKKWRWKEARIGSTYYQIVRLLDADGGLYLRAFLPFHCPLFIPWNAMQRVGDLPSFRNSDELRLVVRTSRGPVNLRFSGSTAILMAAHFSTADKATSA
jgi:hypothetical protein